MLILEPTPPDAETRDIIEATLQLAPRLPILLYYPDTPSGRHAAAQDATRRGVICKAQREDVAEPDRLAELLIPYLKDSHAIRFEDLMQRALAPVPGLSKRFLETAIRQVTRGWVTRPDIETLARASGVSRRQLERYVANAGLPAPRLLLDWVIALWVTWLSTEAGVAVNQAAEHLCLSARDWRRLLTRTQRLPSVSSFAGMHRVPPRGDARPSPVWRAGQERRRRTPNEPA